LHRAKAARRDRLRFGWRLPATRQAIDQHIDSLPNLSSHKRRFLKSHPSLLSEPYLQLMSHAYQIALRAGVPDDSPAMDAAVLAGIHRDLEHHRALSQLTSASARPTPENAQMHDDATEAASVLAREAAQHLAEHQAAHQPPPIAPKPQRKSYPMTAPVSRDAPSSTGYRSQDRTSSPDEREIARVSFPHLPADQAEYEYWKNKRRMFTMKASGEIQGDHH
jgi:hypothetical protein